MCQHAGEERREAEEASKILRPFADAGYADTSNGMVKTIESPVGGKPLKVTGGHYEDSGGLYFVAFPGSRQKNFSTAQEAVEFAEEVIAEFKKVCK